MFNVKNPNQLNIFDPWEFLTPKRRRMLDDGWPGLFREYILPTIPVGKVTKYFNKTFGRPTKELYGALGALILQQSFDLTDEEAVQQYAFNIQWHYALNITEESDSAKYISTKTIWNSRNIVAQNDLEDDIFKTATDRLAQVFNVNTDVQRIDSVHIKSNMRRLGRIGMGYIGASLTGVGTGYLIEKFGWNAGFYFWIFGAIFAAIMMALIWIYKEQKVEHELSVNKVITDVLN